MNRPLVEKRPAALGAPRASESNYDNRDYAPDAASSALMNLSSESRAEAERVAVDVCRRMWITPESCRGPLLDIDVECVRTARVVRKLLRDYTLTPAQRRQAENLAPLFILVTIAGAAHAR